jgi:integrase
MPGQLKSERQVERITSTIRNSLSDLSRKLSDPSNLKVYKFKTPASVRAIKIDDQVLCVGWPDQEELAEWGGPDEDHLFLSETRLPLTKNGMTQLFARLKKRSGITGKRVSPHIFRHTFAIRYLVLGNDPFSLQELLGHEDMSTVKNYMHMNDETIQEQKRKYSPGDHLPTRMPGLRETRRQSGKRNGSSRKKE